VFASASKNEVAVKGMVIIRMVHYRIQPLLVRYHKEKDNVAAVVDMVSRLSVVLRTERTLKTRRPTCHSIRV